jgi:hypothetical protein
MFIYNTSVIVFTHHDIITLNSYLKMISFHGDDKSPAVRKTVFSSDITLGMKIAYYY